MQSILRGELCKDSNLGVLGKVMQVMRMPGADNRQHQPVPFHASRESLGGCSQDLQVAQEVTSISDFEGWTVGT